MLGPMSSSRLSLLIALSCASLSLLGCERTPVAIKDAEVISVVPSSMHGEYGQEQVHNIDNVSEVPYLTVTAEGLELSYGTKVEIVEADVQGDVVQVKRARVRKPNEKRAMECMGSITLRDDKLLISLFDAKSDNECDKTFALNDWIKWNDVATFDEPFAGRYLQGMGSFGGPTIIELKGKKVTLSGGEEADEPVDLVKAQRLGSSDEFILVREAKIGAQTCEGVIYFTDEERRRIVAGFTEIPVEGAEFGPGERACTVFNGGRISSDLSKFPTKKLTNGKTTVQIVDGKFLITEGGAEGTRCELEVLKTESLPTTSRYSAEIPIFGGELANLIQVPSQQTGEDCTDKLIGRCVQAGVGYDVYGEPLTAEAAGLDAEAVKALDKSCKEAGDFHATCPEALVVKEESSTTYKIGATPLAVVAEACFDFTGEFKVVE